VRIPLTAEMLRTPAGMRSAGHLEEPDLESERQPVQHPPPSPDGCKLAFFQAEGYSTSIVDKASGNRS
jgi:hypothetical protein